MENEEVVLPKEEHDKLVEDLAKYKEGQTNAVEELKNLRTEKAVEVESRKAKEEELEALKVKAQANDPEELSPEKVQEMASEKVLEILKKDAEEKKAANAEEVEKKFKESHNEFHPDNDEGGIKYAAFGRVLEKFNLDVDKVETVYEDAYRLMVGETKAEEAAATEAPAEPAEGATPPTSDPNILSLQEKKMVNETFGGDTEKYLKLKAKDPEYFENLTQFVR